MASRRQRGHPIVGVAEVSPSNLRASGMGVGYGVGNLGKFIGRAGLAVIAGSSNFVSPKATPDAPSPSVLSPGFLVVCILSQGSWEARMRMFLGGLLILCLVQTPFARAQSQGSPDKSLAARTEYIPIETLTLSDQQFLTGDKGGGKPVIVAGQLRLAQGPGQSPVVILVHGSGGVATNNEMWERWFNQLGISTFALDGFTGRGLTSLQADQSQLGRLNMIVDVYRSLALLAKHPGIDRNRIALMGFSRGGQIALYASVRRFQKLWNESGIEIAAYIPLYAQCYEGYIDDSDVSGPIRLFHGVPDDYNPIAPCRSYVERLRKAGKDVQLIEYADTWHVFDSPTNPITPMALPAAQTVRNCVIKEDRPGHVIDAASGEPFSWQDACVERGVHVAANPVALKATQDTVKTLLRTVFKLD